MRLRRHGSGEHAEASHGIDLAPMLDFVLNLLIFFIITAVFAKEYGVMVNRPGGELAAGGAGGKGSIAIQILSSGDVFVEDRAVDLRAVRANVERLHAVNPGKGVIVIAEEKAPTGVVIEAVDQVRQGGVWDITFATGDSR